jgi:hypothetical protein
MTPIEPHTIRKGDLIREEYAEPLPRGHIVAPGAKAIEYVAEMDRMTMDRDAAVGHYLLDRPPVLVPADALHDLRDYVIQIKAYSDDGMNYDALMREVRAFLDAVDGDA